MVWTIDPVTHLPTTQLERRYVENVGTATVEYRLEGYRRRQGDPVPGLVRMRVNGTPFMELKLRRYERNPKVEDALFTCGGHLPLPKAAPRP